MSQLPTQLRYLAVALAMMLTGCYSVELDTVQEWCLHMADRDVAEEQAPPWGVIPVVSFEKDAVRDQLVAALDSALLKKVGNRAPRMAWRDSTILHVENLATLMMIDPDSVVSGWREGIQEVNRESLVDYPDECLFGTVATLFDEVRLHYSPHDGVRFREEQVSVIETGRIDRDLDSAK